MQAVEKATLRSTTADVHATPRIPAGGRCIDSRQLFAADNEIVINHGGTSYFLRVTRQGKLILTK